MTIILDGTTGITTPTTSTTGEFVTSVTGFKNRIINGAMVIDQRNAGASVTQGASVSFVTDRFGITGSVASKFIGQQSSTAPVGFVKSLLSTSSSAYTVGASEFFAVTNRIEGNNIADLNWGTANAATVTLSFKVYSSLTGTFGGSLHTYSGDVSYPFSYTVSSANTWTTISLTIVGPTTGTFPTDNSGSLVINFSLGAGATVSGTPGSWSATLYRSATGAVSVVGTNGATFYITGVQLEKGSTATSFDYRPYGNELNLCLRYYWKEATTGSSYVWANGFIPASTLFRGQKQFPVPMRAAPTFSFNTASNSMVCNSSSGSQNISSFSGTFSNIGGNLSFNTAAGGVAGSGAVIFDSSGTAGSYFDFSSEI